MKINASYAFLISGFILSVGFNLPHMISAYEIASPLDMPGWLLWCTMGVIELGILILALNKDTRAAQVFAWIVFLLNLFVYWAPLEFKSSLGFWISLMPGLLFSSVPAFFIFYFSEKISDLTQERNDMESITKALDNVRKLSEDLRTKKENALKELEEARKENDSLRTDLAEAIYATGKRQALLEDYESKLERATRLTGKAGILAEALAEVLGYNKKSADNLRKLIGARISKLEANGISGEDKNKLIVEIAAMEAARSKK